MSAEAQNADVAENEMPVSISVFFPCYNEQENVRRTTEQALAVLDKLNADYEVIIVNDGSADDTAMIADEISAANERVKVVHHAINQGYGAALRTGFTAATRELVFYTDGDGQFDMTELPALIPMIEDCDIVSCYRIKRQDNFVRRLNAFCWGRVVSLLFGMHIRDVDCAFKLYRRKIFDDMDLQSTGALIDTEVLARAVRKGYKIKQAGVHHYPRTAGQQTGANLKVILRAFKELFNLRNQIRTDQKAE